jgi:hypothetical protein
MRAPGVVRSQTALRHDDHVEDQEWLIAYDYGMGGLWGVMIAPSAEAIRAKYPELSVVDERPRWMTEERYAKLRSDPLWLDDEVPTGLLKAAVADRDRP